MSVPTGKFMTWFAIAEGLAVFAILGSDYVAHQARGRDEHDAMLSKVYSALSQNKLTIEVDPSQLDRPWYDAAVDFLAHPINGISFVHDVPKDQKIKVNVTGSGLKGYTSIPLELTVTEMREAAMAAQQFMNAEASDILGHLDKSAAQFTPHDNEGASASILAQSIVDEVPGNRPLADASVHGRLNETSRGHAA